MKKLLTKALNLFSVLLLALALCVSLFCVAAPNRANAAWDGTVAASFSGGSGTEASPYLISSQSQLGYFLKQIASGVTYEGKYIQLTKSLDMTGNIWNTSHYTAFGGIFDGQGYTITADCPFMTVIGPTGIVQGLNYNTHHIQLGRALICDTNNGIIRSCTAYGDVYATSGTPVYGGMICTKNTGTVENCGAIGTLRASGDDVSAYAAMVPQNSGTVTNCFSAMTISASASGKYTESGKCPISRSSYATNSFYDATLYTGSAHCGEGLTTAQLKSAAFLTSLQGTSVPGTRWVTGSHGYPELAHCSTSYAYVSGYQENTEPILYHTASKTITLYSSSTSSNIYYTLDGTDPTTSSTRKALYSGYTMSITGDTVLTMVPYYNSTYGTVTRQTFINLQGGGTETNPYKITTKRQLDAIRLLPDKAFALKNDLTFEDSDFTLGGIAAGGWSPITNFTGRLDGEGHAIIGLRGTQGGMFSTIGTSSVVTSLRLLDHELCGPGDFGAIAKNNSGTITRCYVRSAFTASNLPSSQNPNSGFPYVGGIVGFNRGTISYCRNDGLTVGLGVARYGQIYMGGIAGSNGGTIKSCVNFGDLLLRNYAHADNGYFGGIIGTGNLYEANCRSRCDMTIQNSFDYSVVCTAMSGEDPYLASVASLCIADPFDVTWQLTSHGIPTTRKYAISGIARDSYTLQERALAASYPALDFTSDWMFTVEGPMPQGVMDENGHCLRATAYTASTCTKAGSVTLRCDLCDYSEGQVLLKLPHAYSDYISDGNATCLEDGTKTKKCVDCGLADTIADEGSALGHTFENHVSDGNATCLEDGTKTTKCDRCEVTDTIADTGSALGHSFTNYTSNNDAVCETDGTKTAKCDRCEVTDTLTDEGTALGHSFTDYVSNGDALCETDGTKTAKCDRCEVTDTLTDEGSALGHSFTDYVSNSDATCDTDGTKTAKCDRCEVTDTLTDKGTAGHVFTTYVSNNNATCLFPGTETAQCSRCGDAEDTRIEAGSQKGHSFTNYISNGDATCLEDGTKTAKCDRCTVTDTLPDEGSALGHSFTKYVSDGNVTCMEDGTQTAVCDRCEVTDTITLPALGHDMSQWYTVTEATCQESGLEQADCSRCSHSETQVIPVLAHDYSLSVTEPTCTEQGFTTHTCHCGNSFTDSYVEALGHSFTNYISDGNVTCLEDGTQTAVCDRCSVTDTIVLNALGHSFTSYISLGNATCTADGSKIAQCDRCDSMDFAVDVGSRTGHSLGDWYTVTEAGCLTEGLEQADCANCGKYSETRTIPAAGHSYTEEIVEPTCTEQGYTAHRCHCGESYEDSYTEMLGHSFTDYVSNENATCTEDGTKTAKCDRCDVTDTVTEEGSALGHDMGDRYTAKEATCTEAGLEQTDCSRCDYSETHIIPATGHSYEAVVTEPTCTQQGYTTHTCHCGDSYVDAYTDALGHSFTQYVYNGDATCTEDGTETAKCDRCDVTDTQCLVGSTLGHDMGQWYTVTEANCTEEGLERRDCARCEYCETNSAPANGHPDGGPVVTENEIPATCTTDGSYDRVVYCPVCSEELDRVTYVETATGHRYESYMTEPTCTYGGYTTHVCHCGDSYVDSYTEAIGHSFVDYVPDGNATCTADGTETGKCVICETPDKRTEVGSALGHDMGQWYTVTKPSCAEGGMQQSDCSRCDHSEVGSIPATGHSHEAVVTEPTCTEQGYTTHICHCGDSYVDSHTSALGHSFTEYISDENATCTEDGTKTAKCDRCDMTDTVTDVGSVDGHWLVDCWQVVIEATCTTDGLETATCAKCGNYQESHVIPFTGHSYEAVVTEPTCVEEGYTTHTCQNCGDSYVNSYVGAAGHSFGQWYTAEDVERRDCENCDHYETRDLPSQKLEAPVLTITANTDTGKPKISWTKVAGAEKYRIYRSTKKASGFEYLKSAKTATSYTDTTAEVGVNYYYKIKAYHADSALNSDWSNTVNRVCDLAKPTVTMSVKTDTGKPVVKWETVEGAAKYRVYRSETKSSGYELVYTAITARSYTDTTAEHGINYYYKVKAVHTNPSADSAYSAIVNRVCDLPKPVVEITLTTGGNPRLTWEEIEGAAKYRVYRADSKDGEYELVKTTITVTSFTDKDAASGKTWYYKVRAIHENSSADSAYSSIQSIKAE